jgi:hypothetical protein
MTENASEVFPVILRASACAGRNPSDGSSSAVASLGCVSLMHLLSNCPNDGTEIDHPEENLLQSPDRGSR